MKKSGKSFRRNPPRGGVSGSLSHPPAIQPQLVHRQQRLRFTCTTAQTNAAISFRNLLDTINFASSTTVLYNVFDQVKVASVELWATPALGATSAVACQFGGGTAGSVGDGRVYSDNSMGIEPAHVIARPERMSQAAQWQVSENAVTAFSITCPVGAVIDVMLKFRTVSTVAPNAAANTAVGATVGDVVYRGLDGLAAAGTQLPAVAPVTA